MRYLLLAIVALSAVGCATAPKNDLATFVIQHRNQPGADGQFVVRTSDPAVIAMARQQLALPVEERKLHVNGALAAGDGGYNAPWHWRIEDNQWTLAEISIATCDGWPKYVEENLDHWTMNVKRLCPWASYVAAER